MKQSIFFCTSLLLAGFFFLCTNCQSELIAGPSYGTQMAEAPVVDSLLHQIQDKISNAFVQDFMQKKKEALTELETQLNEQYQSNGQNLYLYWKAYLKYYEAILHLQNGDDKASETAVLAGIKDLENIAQKNDEDYALLALMQSFSIQFVSAFKAATRSGKVKKNAQKSLDLQPQNLRAAYVLASSDYYTPEAYGGGKKTEEYLRMALEMPDQVNPNPYLPSWGREEAYLLLIKHFMKKEQWAEAKEAFGQAYETFPNSYQINELGAKLASK